MPARNASSIRSDASALDHVIVGNVAGLHRVLTRISLSFTSGHHRNSGRNRPTSCDQMHYEQDECNHEEHIGDIGRDSGNAGNAEHTGNQRHNEKHQRIMKHGSLLLEHRG